MDVGNCLVGCFFEVDVDVEVVGIQGLFQGFYGEVNVLYQGDFFFFVQFFLCFDVFFWDDEYMFFVCWVFIEDYFYQFIFVQQVFFFWIVEWIFYRIIKDLKLFILKSFLVGV